MKYFIMIICLLAFVVPATAGQWCQWDGSQGVNCQSDNRGYIMVSGVKISTPARANALGWYRVNSVKPLVGVDQIRDAEVWSFDSNVITRTREIRDMTPQEIDERDARAMPIGEYYIWKTLLNRGIITPAQANAALPQELRDAYQARNRLENP